MLIFKRNMTRLDCKREGFTGIRQCNISNNYEIWKMGEMVKEVSETAILLQPNAIEEAYAEAFGLDPDSIILV